MMHICCKIAVLFPFLCILHQFRSRHVSITVKGMCVFRGVRKNCVNRVLASYRSACSNNFAPPPTGRIFVKVDTWGLFENLSRKFKFHSNLRRKTRILREDLYTHTHTHTYTHTHTPLDGFLWKLILEDCSKIDRENSSSIKIWEGKRVFYVRTCVHLPPHCTDFCGSWYLRIVRKSIEKIQVPLKFEKENTYFTWRPVCVRLWQYIDEFFSEWEMFQSNCRVNRNTFYDQ